MYTVQCIVCYYSLYINHRTHASYHCIYLLCTLHSVHCIVYTLSSDNSAILPILKYTYYSAQSRREDVISLARANTEHEMTDV